MYEPNPPKWPFHQSIVNGRSEVHSWGQCCREVLQHWEDLYLLCRRGAEVANTTENQWVCWHAERREKNNARRKYFKNWILPPSIMTSWHFNSHLSITPVRLISSESDSSGSRTGCHFIFAGSWLIIEVLEIKIARLPGGHTRSSCIYINIRACRCVYINDKKKICYRLLKGQIMPTCWKEYLGIIIL